MTESTDSVSRNDVFLNSTPNYIREDWDHYLSDGRSSSCGAVLVPLIRNGDRLMILFVRRQLFLRRHPGEIAFPGGQREMTDAGPIDTALREMAEETGISPFRIEIINVMESEYTVVSDFRVVPVIAEIRTGFPPEMVLEENEISQAFFLDLGSFSLEPRWVMFNFDGTVQSYPEYHVNDSTIIWGLTGIILYKLLKLFNPEVTE